MIRITPKFVYAFTLLAASLAPAAARADGQYDRYYYRHGHQLDAEIEYSQNAFGQMESQLNMAANQLSVGQAQRLDAEKLKQIVKIEGDMAQIVGLRAFIPPISCVVDCNDAEDAVAKISALSSAVQTTAWHYYSYEELGLLLAQAQGLAKLSYVAPKITEATLLQICSVTMLQGEFDALHIFTDSSVLYLARNFKAVGKNKVTMLAKFGFSGEEVPASCSKDSAGDTHIQVGDIFEVKTEGHTAINGKAEISGWSGTYKGERLHMHQ